MSTTQAIEMLCSSSVLRRLLQVLFIRQVFKCGAGLLIRVTDVRQEERADTRQRRPGDERDECPSRSVSERVLDNLLHFLRERIDALKRAERRGGRLR